jgi:hypothetical protein
MKKALLPIIAAVTLSACSTTTISSANSLDRYGVEKPNYIQAQTIKTVDISPNYCFQLTDNGWKQWDTRDDEDFLSMQQELKKQGTDVSIAELKEPYRFDRKQWWFRTAIGVDSGVYGITQEIYEKDGKVAKCRNNMSQEVDVYSLSDIEATFEHNKQADRNYGKAIDEAKEHSLSKLEF